MAVTDVTVRWLDGKEKHFGDFDANQIVDLRRDEGRALDSVPLGNTKKRPRD